jgi:anti-sigma factor RsiW
MEKHCNKYESLFVFSDEKALNEHLSVCAECAEEHEKMQKVSSLVKES